MSQDNAATAPRAAVRAPSKPMVWPFSREFWRLGLVSEEMLHLDLLRFVASFGIIFSHSFELMLPREMRDASHAHTRDLALFVEVFFVISGYVIAYVYVGKMHSISDYIRFMQRRIGRLLPLHLVTLAIASLLIAAIAAIGMKMDNPPSLSPQCLASAAVMIHAVVPCDKWVPNGASWSISAEMSVYLIFPLLLWLSRWRLFATVLLLPLTVWVAQYVLGGFQAWPSNPIAVRALPTFFLGVMLFRWRDELARIPMGWTLSCLFTAGLVAGSFLRWPSAVNLAMAALAAGFAIAADCRGGAPALVRRIAPLGQITYSTYMIHGIVLLVVANGIGDKVLKLPQAAMAALTLATYGLIFVLSVLSLRLLENPARRWIDSIRIPGTDR